MANITSTTAAKFINDVWSPELNRAITLDLVVDSMFTDKTKQATDHGGGQVFHLPARHNLTAQTKAEGTDVTPEAITETEQTFTPATWQIAAQEIEDFAKVMSMYDFRSEFTLAASYALARARDVACTTLFTNNTTNTVGVLGSELSDDNLLDAWKLLRNYAARPPYNGVVSPAAWTGLLKVEKFIQALYNGDTEGMAVREAQIGKVYQSTFYCSQLTNGTAPSSDGCLWSSDHYFKIIKKAPTQDAWYSPFAKAWLVATDQIYGVFERQEAVEAAAGTTADRLWSVRLRTLK